MVKGFRHNVGEYFEMTRREWLALLITVAVAAFTLTSSFFRQPGNATYSFGLVLGDFVKNFLLVGFLFGVHLLAQKLAGIWFGVKVVYDKYGLGLLVGFLVTFLTFGYWPLFITGYLTYASIPNLRIGKFRATLPKKWEMALVAAIGPIVTILCTIPFNALELATGAAVFHTLTVYSVFLALYALIPVPLIQTPNPYQVYMSRFESMEGNTPGYDIFYAAPVWYFFVLGLIVTFSILALLFSPSALVLLFSLVLGGLAMWLYSVVLETVDVR